MAKILLFPFKGRGEPKKTETSTISIVISRGQEIETPAGPVIIPAGRQDKMEIEIRF